MRASLTVDRSAMSSSVMVLKVSVCLILMAMSHANFGGVSANQGDPPIAIFVDCFLGAELDEDPGPAHCIDAVLDHVEASDVPIRWFFGDQLVFAVHHKALVEVIFLARRVHGAQGGEDSLGHDLAERHRRVVL